MNVVCFVLFQVKSFKICIFFIQNHKKIKKNKFWPKIICISNCYKSYLTD